MLEAAFDEELTHRIEEIANLSDEIVSLKTTLEETISNSKQKIQRTDSSLEFELLRDSTKQVIVCVAGAGQTFLCFSICCLAALQTVRILSSMIS